MTLVEVCMLAALTVSIHSCYRVFLRKKSVPVRSVRSVKR